MKKISISSENLLFCAWGISLIATAGSLYFSEIVGYIPCDLCWYQRILMYPMVIILGIAVIKRDLNQALYSALFSGIGMFVALYQYMLQKVPSMNELDSCGIVPCSAQYINWFGFVTIPFLALIAFILIFIISITILIRVRRSK
ncbi:disulfide oxidoreductase [Alkalihalobacillus hemicellulosilyticus]|nr:disulfide oxidoreductase [Halalkalibacter hemicellulosilyticus]